MNFKFILTHAIRTLAYVTHCRLCLQPLCISSSGLILLTTLLYPVIQLMHSCARSLHSNAQSPLLICSHTCSHLYLYKYRTGSSPNIKNLALSFWFTFKPSALISLIWSLLYLGLHAIHLLNILKTKGTQDTSVRICILSSFLLVQSGLLFKHHLPDIVLYSVRCSVL